MKEINTCSEKPLIYRKTDADCVLYSIGTDFKDDGDIIYWLIPIPGREPEDEESQSVEEGDVGYQFAR